MKQLKSYLSMVPCRFKMVVIVLLSPEYIGKVELSKKKLLYSLNIIMKYLALKFIGVFDDD